MTLHQWAAKVIEFFDKQAKECRADAAKHRGKHENLADECLKNAVGFEMLANDGRKAMEE